MSGAYLTNLIGGKCFLGLDVFNKHVFTKVHESDVNYIESILNACKVWRYWPDNIPIKTSRSLCVSGFLLVFPKMKTKYKKKVFPFNHAL